jgi:hypothetical protein
VANTLDLFRNGAVGFIDWLGLLGACVIRLLSTDPPNHNEHTDGNGTQQHPTDPVVSKHADVIECADGVCDRKKKEGVAKQRSLPELGESIECVNVTAINLAADQPRPDVDAPDGPENPERGAYQASVELTYVNRAHRPNETELSYRHR